MATLVLLDDGQRADQRSGVRLGELQAAIDVLPELVFEKLAECENALEAIMVDFFCELLASQNGKEIKPASLEREWC